MVRMNLSVIVGRLVKMKLTKREKALLLIVFAISVAAIFLNYVYFPLNKEVKGLRDESVVLTMQVQEGEQKKRLVEELENEIIIMKTEADTKNKDILKIWDQPELLAFIEKNIDKLCDKVSVEFYEYISAEGLQSGDIGIIFKANNSNLKKILKKFEEAQYFSTVTSISVYNNEEDSFETADNLEEVDTLEAADDQEILEVNLVLRFYCQNQSQEYPDKYQFMNGEYSKTDIFR